MKITGVKATRHRLFVYGSCDAAKRTMTAWFGSGATHVADGRIQGAELVDLGAYCCIVPTDNLAQTVIGEVYDVGPEVFTGIEAIEAEPAMRGSQ